MINLLGHLGCWPGVQPQDQRVQRVEQVNQCDSLILAGLSRFPDDQSLQMRGRDLADLQLQSAGGRIVAFLARGGGLLQPLACTELLLRRRLLERRACGRH